MRRMKPHQLTAGLILGQDVYKERRIVYRKGLILTDEVIQNLIEWRKSPVYVEDRFESMLKDSPSSHAKLFYERLIYIGQENRYGFAMMEESTYRYLETLFTTMLSDKRIYRLLKQLEKWSPDSFDHSIDVFVLGTLLGRKLGIPDVEQFSMGCLLHDVGKLEIPSYILEKKSKLTRAEYELVKHHAAMGATKLKELGFDDRIIKIARSHHERLDGTGYPDGLSGAQLDVDLQIISIVDVYSALTLPRSYRKPLAAPEALERILEDESAYNPKLLFTFIHLLNIYPPQAEVRLSNGQVGTTVYQEHWQANVPTIHIHDSGETLRLPTDLSLVVTEILNWNRLRVDQSLMDLWQSFIQSLKEGKKENALTAFEILSDGKRVEDIYIDIIDRAVREIEDGTSTEKEVEQARRIACDILGQKLIDFAPSYQTTKHQTIVVTATSDKQLLPTKILHDMLFVNGWKTYYLPLHMNEHRLKRIIEKNNITHLAFYIPTELDAKVTDSIIKELLDVFPRLSVIVYGACSHLISKKAHIQATNVRHLLEKIKKIEEKIPSSQEQAPSTQ